MGIVRFRWAGAFLVILVGCCLRAAAAPVPGNAAENVEITTPPTPAPAPEASAEDGRVKGYVPPPRQLHQVGDHWTPYDPPAPPEGAKVHVVTPGDCLWNLAKQYYDDPYLWPTIWDANRWITYSHWIYPGDPIVVPPHPNVVTEATPEPVAEPPVAAPVIAEVRQPPIAPVAAPAAPRGPVLVPAAELKELACSAQLHDIFDPSPLIIAGTEADKEMQAEGDVIYLSAGHDMSIQPGSEWVVVRPGQTVKNPATRKPQGVYVQRIGRLKVMAVQPHSATATVSLSCDALMKGDFLVPYREMPVPMIERVALRRLATPEPKGEVGVVVVTGDPKHHIAGTGEIVGIDLRAGSGVTSGDRVLFWRPAKGNEPRQVIGQGVVLSTNGGGSMVKILESTEEVEPGDRIEVL